MNPGESAGPDGASSSGSVVAAVVRRGDAVLLARRPAHKQYGSMWEFPGGKVREGESVADAIARELEEELEVNVLGTGPTLFSAHDPGSGFEIRFVEVEVDGTPHALEHEEVRWVDAAEVDALPLAPADKRFALEILSPLHTRPEESLTRPGGSGK